MDLVLVSDMPTLKARITEATPSPGSEIAS
jgi:hypothetical protein